MENTRDTRSEGRALRCDEARVLLMGYLDGELEPERIRSVEEHLAVCVACRADELAFRKLGTMAERTLAVEDSNVDTDVAWTSIYRRIERGAGWLLLWMGILILSGFGLWEFMSVFLTDPDVPMVYRLGSGAFAAGALVLLVSFLREHLQKYSTERYREIQR